MSEEAIKIAMEYMARIYPRFENAVLKILHAYAERRA